MAVEINQEHMATAGIAATAGALLPKLIGSASKFFTRKLRDERQQGALEQRVANLEGWVGSMDTKLDQILLLLAGKK